LRAILGTGGSNRARKLRPLFGVLALAMLPGCVHGPKTYADYPMPQPSVLSAASQGPQVDALLARFYDDPSNLPGLRQQLAGVLALYPASSRAHEVAGYLATLDADSAAATDHWIAAASDLDSPLTALYLWELEQNAHTATEQSRMQRLLEALVRQHPSAAVRARARVALAGLLRRRYQLEEARKTSAELGYVSVWNLIGAFDNDQGKGFLTSYPPEIKLALSDEYPGKVMPVRWRAVRADDTGKVPLDDLVYPRDHALAYLASFVETPHEGPAELRLSVGDAVSVWVNDAAVAAEEKIEWGASDNLVIPIQLNRGWNKVLIKTCVHGGNWSVAARLTDLDGNSLPPYRVRTDPQPYTPAVATKAPARIPFLPAALAQISSVARREFLSSRWAAAAGRYREVLPPLERMLAARAESPLVRYYASLAYTQNDELGKAIDVLNTAVEHSPELAAFLLERGRYYKHKKLWSQALPDLRKLLQPNSPPELRQQRRDVSLELGDVYRRRGFNIDQCQELEALLRAVPDLAVARLRHAECLDDLGYTERAEQEIGAGLALEPGQGWLLNRSVSLFARRLDFAQALAQNTRLRAEDPFSVMWLAQQADLQRRSGDQAGATRSLSELRAQDPDWPVPYERLADLAYEGGQPQQALPLYELALARNPRSAALGERVEFLKPKELGLIEQLAADDAQIDAAIQSAPQLEVLPGSYAVVLLDHQATEIGADGSAKNIVTRVARAENEQGVDQLTHARLPGGNVKVLRAYAISPRGERQEATSVQETSVRFRKLETGAITVLQYVHYQPPGVFLPNHYAETWFLQDTNDQLENSTWAVVHAKDRELRVSKQGAVDEAQRSEGDRIIRTFSARHVAPLVNEAFMPPPADLLAQVSVTTLTTWDEYVRWERALLSDAFRVSPELEALAARLTKDAATPRDKLDQLYQFVTRQIRYQQEYETTIAGVRPHPGPLTLERGYGDCKDKAVLLIRLAKLVGLNLDFALLRTTDAGKVRRDIPNQQFNHAIVYVPEQAGLGSAFFLDPTTDGLDIGNLRADDQGALSLVIDPDGTDYHFIEIPHQDAELDFDRHHLTIQIKSPTEASAVDDITMRGSNAAALRRLLRNRGVADKMLQNVASALFTGAALKDSRAKHGDDLWNPLELALTLDVSAAIQAQGDHWRLPLPVFFPDLRASALVTRRTPVHFGPFTTVTYQTEAELPEGYRIVQAPAPFAIEHGCFRASRTAHVDGRRVELQVDFVRTCSDIGVNGYGEFRGAALEVLRELREEVVFARQGPSKPSPQPPRAQPKPSEPKPGQAALHRAPPSAVHSVSNETLR
jgi:tetratricopeptide (TPR) repeat protein